MSDNQKNLKDEKKIVFPSNKLGVEEEFLASVGAYIENHEVRSAVFGEQFIDKKNYRARVFSLPKGSIPPRRYDTVIAEVIRVLRSSVRLKVGFLNGKPLHPAYSAIMHISDASRDYIKDIDDFYTAGDIIRATIIDAKSIPLQLECKKGDSGVIHTTCVKCGESVKKVKRDLLVCNECGWKQTRKTSIDYGNVNLSM
ncbi:MAG: exosome complex RNA-binding protein Csl4 [Candidatus Kariarchaeaceae archaeon]